MRRYENSITEVECLKKLSLSRNRNELIKDIHLVNSKVSISVCGGSKRNIKNCVTRSVTVVKNNKICVLKITR